MSLRARQALTICIGAVVAVVMLVLGLWQMSSFQLSMVDVAAERAAQPALSLTENVSDDGSIEDVYGRRVQVSGQVINGREFFVGTDWPMRVVVPFQSVEGHVIPIVIGLADGPVEVTNLVPMDLEGIFTAGDLSSESPVPTDAPPGSTATLRLQEVVQQWPQPLVAGYVTLNTEGAAKFGLTPAQAELPEAQGSAMHQGYALQWWVFAAAAVAFSIVVARGFKPEIADENSTPRS